jgi:hypothetical protein
VEHDSIDASVLRRVRQLALQSVAGCTLTLLGEVSRLTLKSDAERAVKEIEGVERVDNQIKVLHVSPNDDRIRRATYRKIYGNSVLSQYQLRAVPPIHIIVENGHVTWKVSWRAKWRSRSLECKLTVCSVCSRWRTICEWKTTRAAGPGKSSFAETAVEGG